MFRVLHAKLSKANLPLVRSAHEATDVRKGCKKPEDFNYAYVTAQQRKHEWVMRENNDWQIFQLRSKKIIIKRLETPLVLRSADMLI